MQIRCFNLQWFTKLEPYSNFVFWNEMKKRTTQWYPKWHKKIICFFISQIDINIPIFYEVKGKRIWRQYMSVFQPEDLLPTFRDRRSTWNHRLHYFGATGAVSKTVYGITLVKQPWKQKALQKLYIPRFPLFAGLSRWTLLFASTLLLSTASSPLLLLSTLAVIQLSHFKPRSMKHPALEAYTTLPGSDTKRLICDSQHSGFFWDHYVSTEDSRTPFFESTSGLLNTALSSCQSEEKKLYRYSQ